MAKISTLGVNSLANTLYPKNKTISGTTTTPTGIPLAPNMSYGTPTPVVPVTKTVNANTTVRPKSSYDQSVASLQTQLNAKNQGQAGYVPLVVDGILGPKTRAAQNYVSSTGTPTGSVSDIASRTGYSFTQNPDDLQADNMRQSIYDYNLEQYNQKINPDEIYQGTLAKYQAQIDALNNIYNDQINQARVQGAGRLESRKFSQGRSGQIGSGTGEAGINAVQDANTEIENSINNQRAAAIASVLANVRNSADAELKAKTAAKQQGADELLKFLNDVPGRKKARLSSAIQALVAQGIDVSQLTEEELQSYASGLGVDVGAIEAEFNAQQQAAQSAATKAEQEAMKALPSSAQEYEYAKKNGFKGTFSQYQNEDANRKAKATSGATKLSASEQKASVVGTLAKGLVPGQTIPGTQGVPFIDGNGYLTVEGFKTAVNAAQQDGLPRDEFIAEFGSLMSPTQLAEYGITPREQKYLQTVLTQE